MLRCYHWAIQLRAVKAGKVIGANIQKSEVLEASTSPDMLNAPTSVPGPLG